jgi:mitochondrial fission protein ELM1
MPAAWIIASYRAGEASQVKALARALSARGYTIREITLSYRLWGVLPHLLEQASLAGLTPECRSQLRAPWPDLIITSGVRNEPVCRWIRNASGGRARYVHVGKPWAALNSYDLIITTPQYRAPQHPRVLNNALTLHGLDAAALQAAGQQWRDRFSAMPQPWTGVLIGGDSGPFTLGPRAAERLLQQAREHIQASGGSLLITTSARTRVAVRELLARELDRDEALQGRTLLHIYEAGQAENPYAGILALADDFIVTGDSIGMLSEVCATGRPIRLFDLGGMRNTPQSRGLPRDARLGATLYALIMRYLPERLTRDITRVHEALLASDRVSWLDTPLAGVTPASASDFSTHQGADPRSADLDRALVRIDRLLGEAPDPDGAIPSGD